MVQTYSDNKFIYSVDMMFAYIYFNKPKYQLIPVNDLLKTLEYDGWGDPIKNIKYSALDVINNPKKYKDDFNRIKKADLSYPIILSYDNNIVDGVHRLTKSYLEKKDNIKAYKFDKNTMKKFIIGKYGEWNKVDNMNTYNFIILYEKRFH